MLFIMLIAFLGVNFLFVIGSLLVSLIAHLIGGGA